MCNYKAITYHYSSLALFEFLTLLIIGSSSIFYKLICRFLLKYFKEFDQFSILAVLINCFQLLIDFDQCFFKDDQAELCMCIFSYLYFLKFLYNFIIIIIYFNILKKLKIHVACVTPTPHQVKYLVLRLRLLLL